MEHYDEHDIYGCFLMGRSDEEYYVYNLETKKYGIYEMGSLDVMDEFDDFASLFIDTVGGRAASVYRLTEDS
jgi:hypothetical protein